MTTEELTIADVNELIDSAHALVLLCDACLFETNHIHSDASDVLERCRAAVQRFRSARGGAV